MKKIFAGILILATEFAGFSGLAFGESSMENSDEISDEVSGNSNFIEESNFIEKKEEKAPFISFGKPFWKFVSTTDLAYYPKSEFKSGGDHFSTFSGFYERFEARETADAIFTIPFHFGKNKLFQGNKIALTSSVAITPVSIFPKASISITPIAFFTASFGAGIGTAWELLGVKSISRYDARKKEYVQMDAFKTWFYSVWSNFTFMFDTGAIFPGEWNHVVAVASFEFSYSGLLNADEEFTLYKWQTNDHQMKSGKYNYFFLLGYQMPLKLNLVGINVELSGFYDKDLEPLYSAFKGSFMQIDIGPMAQVKITEKDSATFMIGFSSRRSFEEEHSEKNEEPLLHHSGREWFFNRLAIRWIHNF